jgi:hypothetical protein
MPWVPWSKVLMQWTPQSLSTPCFSQYILSAMLKVIQIYILSASKIIISDSLWLGIYINHREKSINLCLDIFLYINDKSAKII